jgi:hypothetical protein
MRVFFLFAISLSVVHAALGDEPFHCARYVELADGVRELILSDFPKRAIAHDAVFDEQEGVFSHRVPRFFIEHEPLSNDSIVEVCSASQSRVLETIKKRRVRVNRASTSSDSSDDREEVFVLIENGPSANRIDLVFMGDGYLESEKGKFLGDMKRLTREMFEGNTFRSYLPVFNVYAVFKPSAESGIGKNDRPKNTAYKLYRAGNTLRAIYVGNPSAAHVSCSRAPGCDYPILVGNDPYYGGLGGEFSVTTSSVLNGTVVLRHELGHSVGDIGEEYDGGGYFGANHAGSVSSVGWGHWLSDTLREEPSVAREISWPWVNLAAGPFAATFVSDGKWALADVEFSVAGAQTDDDFTITLDGEKLPFKSPGHGDRDFHQFDLKRGFTAGFHQLLFAQGVYDGDNWVANIRIHEYGSDYHFEKGYVSAYPLFAGTRAQGYRPTHETCLMRQMKSDRFCSICQENNWLKFFSSINLIDGVTVTNEANAKRVSVVTQKLGQFRQSAFVENERVTFRWFKNSVEQKEFEGQSSVLISSSDSSAHWEVEAGFKTPEVGKDSQGLLKSRKKVM